MWKKWMTIVFISVFAFTMAACGSSGRTNDSSSGQGTEQTESGTSGLKNDRGETGDETSAETLPEENEGSAGIRPEEDDGSHILIALKCYVLFVIVKNKIPRRLVFVDFGNPLSGGVETIVNIVVVAGRHLEQHDRTCAGDTLPFMVLARHQGDALSRL